MSTSSYSLIQKLLEFQSSFINLVHSEILAFTQPEQKKQVTTQIISQALLKFQILRMGDKNETFNEMVLTLKKELIQQKQQADPVLKSYFTKILDMDFLPFMHINRYELTKLSIFGFDIYIDPLQAILQILNRLERTFYILEQCLKEGKQYQEVRQKGSWQILVSGWQNYYIYLNFYKLSLNIYMLREYIQTADTSLFKKDKEIIFTGVYNFYKKFVPKLIQMEQVQFLEELADLNNTMYSFHGSFDYFLFYTCLRPEKRFIKVYDRVKDLETKCKATNILTPLLFGILNNFKAFKGFINQVQSREYIHLLRVLLSGLIINFKLRILQYDQVLELIGSAITKLNLLKGMKFEIISGDLSKEWREAKDFFISAFKSGYNVGEIQTWNLCESEKIQPRIRNFLTEATLLLNYCKSDDFIKSLERAELEQILSNQIFELTSGTETLSSLSNNWKKISISETECMNSKCLNIIRIANLMNVIENFSEKLLYAICSAMIDINCGNDLLRSVLAQSAETVNSMITVINRKEAISNLKYLLPDFHKKYTPKSTFQGIVPVYLHCFIIKESLTNLLEVIEKVTKEDASLYLKQILTSLIQKYCPKPQNTFKTLKNFEKEYKLPYETVHMDSQITSVLTNLTKIVAVSEGFKFKIASEMLINLLGYCPWYVVSVLNLPAMINEQIQSFLSWLIKSQNPKSSLLLNEMLELIEKFSLEKEAGNLKQYLNECIYLSVLDTILKVLDERTKHQKWHGNTSNVNEIIKLVQLLVQIDEKFLNLSEIHVPSSHQSEGFSKIWPNLLELLSFLLRNCDFSVEIISKSCQLYWRIIKRIRGHTIQQWCQKTLFNLVFSGLGSDSLSTYETFKGISMISSSKNYMTSKEPQGQSEQSQKDSFSERYNFSEVKQFLEARYTCFESDGITEQNLEDLVNEFDNLNEKSANKQTPIKISSIHVSNDRETLPTLSQQTLNGLYTAYCEKYGKEKILAKFCLNLLKLNSLNHKVLWNLAKKNQKFQFLSELKFTRQTIGQIFEIIQKFQKSSSQSIDQNKIIESMLNFEQFSQKLNELQLLSSSFHFEPVKIEKFIMKRDQLWFLIVCNNSNWRQFNEVFSNYLRNQNFMSTLLQYKEFLSITKKSSKDYEEKIDQFTQILGSYVFYIEKKILFIQMLKMTDSEQENNIRKQTLLLNVKLALLKCEFERIVERMVSLGKLLSQNSIQTSSFNCLILQIRSLNTFCNILAEGNISLPTFSYHNGYLIENSESKQFMLGRWLENVEKVFGDKAMANYLPNKEVFSIKSTVSDFLAQKTSESQDLMLRVLDQNTDQSAWHQEYIKLQQQLKEYFVQEQRNVTELAIRSQSQIDPLIKLKFYQFGHLLSFKHRKQNQDLDENLLTVSPLLRSLIKRDMLPLQLVKEVDPSSYHHLKLVEMEEGAIDTKITKGQAEKQPQTRQSIEEQKSPEKICSEENLFVWRDKQLIEGGKSILVNQSNKRQYVDLVAEEALGKNYLFLNKALALGYLNSVFRSQK